MDREELQAVIVHEMAHIRGHDTRIAQMAAVMVGGFGLVLGSIWWSAAARRRGDIGEVRGFGFVALPLLIIGGIGWIFSKMAAIALSRNREFLADALAVEFTRNPAALIRALEHIAKIESPLKASLRGMAALFIVDPFECGRGASAGDYLDEVARIEAQQDKTKEQREAEVLQYVSTAMPRGILDAAWETAFSSHPPIRARIMRLAGLSHYAPALAQGPEPGIEERRKAVAEKVKELADKSPEAMAAVVAGMLAGTGPGALLKRALDPDASDPQGATAPQEDIPYADAPEQESYRKLYEYNLALTGDRLRLAEEQQRRTESPFETMTSATATKLGPEELRAALAAGIASAYRRRAAPAPPSEAAAEKAQHGSRTLRAMFWIVIAFSAGAIVAASLAIR